METSRQPSFRVWAGGALAACLMVAFFITFGLLPVSRVTPGIALHHGQSLGVTDLAGLVYSDASFDFRGDSVSELRAWLMGRGAPAPDVLPDSFLGLAAVGCRVISDGKGNEITLLCLKKNGEWVHLFVAEGAGREAFALTEKTWTTSDGWNAYFWTEGDRGYALLSQIEQEELAELLI